MWNKTHVGLKGRVALFKSPQCGLCFMEQKGRFTACLYLPQLRVGWAKLCRLSQKEKGNSSLCSFCSFLFPSFFTRLVLTLPLRSERSQNHPIRVKGTGKRSLGAPLPNAWQQPIMNAFSIFKCWGFFFFFFKAPGSFYGYSNLKQLGLDFRRKGTDTFWQLRCFSRRFQS